MPTRPNSRPRRNALGLLIAVVAAFATLTPAAAQPGGVGRAGHALSLGARGGYDFQADAPLLGAYLRSDVAWRLTVQATGDLTFLDGLTERQAGADLLFRLQPGLALGGGVVVRNSVFAVLPPGSQDPIERDTKVGYSIVAVLGGGGSGRFVNALELRFTSVDRFDSQILALQLGIPLFRW